MCPTQHYVTCAFGARWWLLCGETSEEFAYPQGWRKL